MVLSLVLPRHDSIESAATSINQHLYAAAKADSSANYHRVMAGRELIAIRPKIEEIGLGWEAWCRENITRSMRDIRRVMKIAASPDPEAALEEERTQAREGMVTSRTNVSPVDRLIRDFEALNEDDKIEFMSRTGLVKEEIKG